MPREVFVAGQILTAAEMNIVSDQTVMSFAGTAARGSAIPTPSEGMAVYLQDSNIVSLYDGADWKNSLGVTGGILQVVSTTKTDTFTTTSNTFVDITGLSASITPSSTNSKILAIFAIGALEVGASVDASVNLVRNSTAIAHPASGARAATIQSNYEGNLINGGMIFLDSPSSTSAITYKLQTRVSGGNTVFINRQVSGSASSSVSTITLMEVAG